MTDKFDFYDVMATLVPGILIVAFVGVLFPSIKNQLGADHEGAFTVMALTALSIFAGQLLVAVGSLLEPLLFRTWGGRPSDIALIEGLGNRYLPKTKGVAIKAVLAAECEPDAEGVSMFIKAMALASGAGNGKVDRFNGLYAYHRTLLLLGVASFVLVVLSRSVGLAQEWSLCGFIAALVLLCGFVVLFWHRAKQRAFYFVREVLLTAERVVNEKNATKHAT